MRLTERKVCYPECDKQGNITKVDYIDIKDKKMAEEKLCQLEDIEDELGIDLITLFKALKNGVYYITKTYGLRCEYIDITTDYNGSQTIAIKLRIKGKPQLLKQDYGKTWALTKKELENEIH